MPARSNPHHEPFGVLPQEAPDTGVTRWKGFDLLPFQVRSLEAVRRGHNVLVAAPTGAGKTLVAEYAMEDAMKRGKRCIYTSPIKALSNQKYRDFRDDPEVDVGLMTGDVTIHPQAQVLIMTTEILRNAIFEGADLLHDVEYVIFDEIHYMDDRERGMVWEESLIFLPPAVRLICLSATIENVEELGAWLGEIREQAMEVVSEKHRPVPLEHRCWTENDGIFPPKKLDSVRKREVRNREQQERRRGGSRRDSRRSSRRGGRGRGSSRGGFSPPPDPGPLFDQLQSQSLLPALVFSFSRRDCERLARASEFRQLLDEQEQEAMVRLQGEMVELFQLSPRVVRGEVLTMARSGVCYHHAGMLPIFKEMVERMFTAGLLKLLFTTETFALGINMPARTVVFNGLRKFDGISFDYLRVRDFMQMAGRAGRQGIDEQGTVFCVLGARDLAEAPIDRWIEGRPEPVTSRFKLSYSTLLHLVEVIGRERLPEAWERSFHRFQARGKGERTQGRRRRDQKRVIDQHLSLLDELGYLDGDEITARGRMARLLNGYELQMTEMLFQGTLENLPPKALAAVFVAMIYEERRRFDKQDVPSHLFANLRRQVSSLMGELCGREARLGIEPPMKRPEWGLTPAVMVWYEGGDVEALEEASSGTAGDTCRVFRMAIQLMRNVRRVIDRDWDLYDSLGDAVEAMNRDEIDARRQLELG